MANMRKHRSTRRRSTRQRSTRQRSTRQRSTRQRSTRQRSSMKHRLHGGVGMPDGLVLEDVMGAGYIHYTLPDGYKTTYNITELNPGQNKIKAYTLHGPTYVTLKLDKVMHDNTYEVIDARGEHAQFDDPDFNYVLGNPRWTAQ